MQIIQSIEAVRMPDVPTPRTADMAAIVDAHRAAGLYPRPVPAAFQIGRDKMVMHPAIYAELQKHTRKGRVVKAKRIIAFNDSNHAIVELEDGSYTVVGGRHSPNGNWAVLSYGLDHFTQAVLHGLVRIGLLDKKQVNEHIATAGERQKARDRKHNIKRIRELCAEIGVEPPQIEETERA